MRRIGLLPLLLLAAVAPPAVLRSGTPGVTIEDLSLEVREAFPLGVEVTLRGRLRSPCAGVDTVEQRFEPARRTYTLDVTAFRAETGSCDGDEPSFEVTVPLVKAGLAAGRFEVEAGGHEASFEIQPLGDFPGIDLPSAQVETWICAIETRVCFSPPPDWRRQAGEWISPAYLSARLGFRWRHDAATEVAAGPGMEIVRQARGRVSWGPAIRIVTRRSSGERWKERLISKCGELECEFWLEAPSEPLLDAAGESFAQMVRFATRH